MKRSAKVTPFVVGLLLVIGMASPSHATDNQTAQPESAFGTTPISSFTYSWGGVTINVPAGCFLTHGIRGNGRRVTNQNAGTDCTGAGNWNGGFCNWKIDFIYYDTNDKHYLTNPGKTHNSCDHNTFRHEPKDWNVPRYGKTCATFQVNGKERARQCHSITR